MTGRTPGFIGSLLALALVTSPTAFAYESPLDSESIREAYFLGQRGDEKTTAFFDLYAKHLSLPDKGPYIELIELLTPYARVVSRSSESVAGYSAQHAELDYRADGDIIQVRVRIKFTSTYTAVKEASSAVDVSGKNGFVLRSQDFWRDFQVQLLQNKTPIEPRDIHGTPLFDDSGFIGAEVWFAYGAKAVRSEDTAVEVLTPEGQRVSADFDLSKLR